MIDTIIFDLEGVILNTEVLWDKSQEVFFEKLNIDFYPEEIKPLVTGRNIVDSTRLIKQYYKISIDEDSLLKLRFYTIRNLFALEVNYIDGFKDFLRLLNNKGFKKCIATSLSKVLFDEMNLSKEINQLFKNKIFFNSEVNLPSKPEPEIYLFAANKMKSHPKNCIVIEDSPIGITAAKKANMTCIALSTTFNHSYLVGADYIYNSYKEIMLDEIIQTKSII